MGGDLARDRLTYRRTVGLRDLVGEDLDEMIERFHCVRHRQQVGVAVRCTAAPTEVIRDYGRRIPLTQFDQCIELGPIQSGSVTGMNTQGSAVGVPDGVPGGTGVARDGDLSVTARPASDMNSILRSHYPEIAEQQGVMGTANVAVEILADGSVGSVQPRGESVSGFGFARACSAAVREARWTVARDRNGTPVASHVRFRCVFDVRR